ncbi:hypothetical protein GXY_02431 [Novacetimonas hansenii ATCC 23769]|uniref:Uncharacterized protein n=1 Tax=Novacetimonas hansenii ATCC 23769 TaxID=714995 RepID=D5QBJ2_NOVHA|nr:hypothetical protein GXY_02431 [Novacetimonas hansenii ATCC 23769]
MESLLDHTWRYRQKERHGPIAGRTMGRHMVVPIVTLPCPQGQSPG